MDDIPQILVTLGAIFLLGLFTDLLGRRTFLPRVTFVTGWVLDWSWGFNLLPDLRKIGSRFHGYRLIHGGIFGGPSYDTSISSKTRETSSLDFYWEVLGAAVAMFLGLLLLGFSPEIALLLAGIAPQVTLWPY